VDDLPTHHPRGLFLATTEDFDMATDKRDADWVERRSRSGRCSVRSFGSESARHIKGCSAGGGTALGGVAVSGAVGEPGAGSGRGRSRLSQRRTDLASCQGPPARWLSVMADCRGRLGSGTTPAGHPAARCIGHCARRRFRRWSAAVHRRTRSSSSSSSASRPRFGATQTQFWARPFGITHRGTFKGCSHNTVTVWS
jgi:hypothetical protein